MNKRNFAYLVSCFLVITLLGGCAQKAFLKAKSENTLDSYSNFLKNHERSEYSEEANTLMEPLLFEDARSKNSSSAYQNYLSKFPDGHHVEEAIKLMENAYYIETVESGTVNDYETFIQKYPDSEHSDDILDLLKDELLEELLESLAEELIDRFLDRFPKGKHADKARVLKYIAQLKNPNENIRTRASNNLIKMGSDLNKSEVETIKSLMRRGKEGWRKKLYRQSHCTWYERTSVKYYAANTLLQMNSKYVTSETKNEARRAKNSGKSKYKVDDPGWI